VIRPSAIGWLGTRTPHYEEMARFAEQVLGLTPVAKEDGMTVFRLPNGDLFEVFGPDNPGGGHPPEGVVGGFVVEDVEAAAEELRAAGCEVGELQGDGGAQWVYFRAPDGNLYELTTH